MASLRDMCKEGSVSGVLAALERGEGVDTRGGNYNTGLMLAAATGHEAVVSLLLERGADVNAVDSKQRTALYYTCANKGNADVARILLENGAAVNALAFHQMSALHMASSQGSVDVVRILLAQPGVDCNPRARAVKYFMTPIMLAVRTGQVECVRVLAGDCRVKLDTTDNKGWTLENAASDKPEIVTILNEARHKLKKEDLTRKAKLCKDVSKLLSMAETSDLTVVCHGEELPCHCAILTARSPVFARGLSSNFAEGTEGRWIINNAEPADVKDMLHYIYTSDIPNESLGARALELLELASQYELPELEEACREALMKGISTSNAVATLVLLDRLQITESEKGEVIEFIKKHAKRIVKGKDWDVFMSNYPNLVTDIVTGISDL